MKYTLMRVTLITACASSRDLTPGNAVLWRTNTSRGRYINSLDPPILELGALSLRSCLAVSQHTVSYAT